MANSWAAGGLTPDFGHVTFGGNKILMMKRINWGAWRVNETSEWIVHHFEDFVELWWASERQTAREPSTAKKTCLELKYYAQ